METKSKAQVIFLLTFLGTVAFGIAKLSVMFQAYTAA